MFHTLCYQNQVNECPEKLNLLLCHKDQGGAQSKFQEIFRISFATRKKKQNRLQKVFPGVAKSWPPYYPGVALATPCHPIATGLMRKSYCIITALAEKRKKLHGNCESTDSRLGKIVGAPVSQAPRQRHPWAPQSPALVRP